jgi:hypothetical protein
LGVSNELGAGSYRRDDGTGCVLDYDGLDDGLRGCRDAYVPAP